MANVQMYRLVRKQENQKQKNKKIVRDEEEVCTCYEDRD